MRLLFILCLLASFFLPHSLSAQEACTPIRIDGPGQALNKWKVSNQSVFPSCDLNAAVGLLSADTPSFSRDGGAASTIYAWAVMATRGNPRTDAEDAIPIMIAHGRFCTADGMAEVFRERLNKSDMCFQQAWALRTALFDNSDAGNTRSFANCPANVVDAMDNLTKVGAYTSEKDADAAIRGVVAGWMGRSDTTWPQFLSYVDERCKSWVDYSTLKKAVVYETAAKSWADPAVRHRHMRAVWDAGLDASRPRPVAIRYCAMVLRDANWVGTNPVTGNVRSNLCSSPSSGNYLNHSSFIAGRRPGPRGCQYLVVNSWGGSCATYDKKWECDAGKVWVDASALVANTSGSATLFLGQ
jgi:hypothetical protein